jgi:predicted TIM-barrel fold metal-dependent hydrolase
MYWEDELTLSALAQQFTMFRFFPGLQGWPIDFAPFGQILKVLSEAGKPLLDRSITLPRPTRGWRLWTNSGVPILVAIDKPGDATQLMRMASDYPAPVVMVGVTTQTLVEALVVMRSREQFVIETHALTAPDGLLRIRDAVGANRIAFGSGGSALSISAAVSYVNKSKLSDVDKESVLSGTAASLVQGGR